MQSGIEFIVDALFGNFAYLYNIYTLYWYILEVSHIFITFVMEQNISKSPRYDIIVWKLVKHLLYNPIAVLTQAPNAAMNYLSLDITIQFFSQDCNLFSHTTYIVCVNFYT